MSGGIILWIGVMRIIDYTVPQGYLRIAVGAGATLVLITAFAMFYLAKSSDHTDA
jgi:hypothetical protein